MSSLLKSLQFGLLAAAVSQCATIATYSPGTTLENITIAPSGTLYVTASNSGTVYQVAPSGASQSFGQAPGSTLGISRDVDGTIVSAGGANFYRFSDAGTASIVTQVAGTQMLNGIALLRAGTFLVADSRAATIW